MCSFLYEDPTPTPEGGASSTRVPEVGGVSIGTGPAASKAMGIRFFRASIHPQADYHAAVHGMAPRTAACGPKHHGQVRRRRRPVGVEQGE